MTTSYNGVESTFSFCPKKDEDWSWSCKNRCPFPLPPRVLLFFLFLNHIKCDFLLETFHLNNREKNQVVIGELHNFLHSNILTFKKNSVWRSISITNSKIISITSYSVTSNRSFFPPKVKCNGLFTLDLSYET